MLDRMDIPGTATAPWLLLGVVLGVLLVLLAGLIAAWVLRRRRPTPPVQPPRPDDGRDDLPAFLECPPGSGAGPTVPQAGWAALTAPAVPVAPPSPPSLPSRGRRDAVVVLTAMAVTALLLVGAVAAVAATSGPDGRRGAHSRDGAPAARDAAAARLTFGGLVLEPRAVGITATYPVVELAADGDGAWARLEFPTFNCLTAEAPADPVAAGCTPSVPEYAELRSPDLVVDRDGHGLRVSGRFATEVRPNGSAPEATGRAYDVRIAVRPADGGSGRGWRPAEGVLELGTGRAETVDKPGVSVYRSNS
jgi:hypothetical protein